MTPISFKKNRILRQQKNAKILFHSGYHKCMTNYFRQVLKHVAIESGLAFNNFTANAASLYHEAANVSQKTMFFIPNAFVIEYNKLPPYLGSHLIRDPRDILVSAYRYHLWTKETWANLPISRGLLTWLNVSDLGLQKIAQGKSYVELLNIVDKDTGYMLELNRMSRSIRVMTEWNYQTPFILELRYEDVFGNEEFWFTKLLKHFGFSGESIQSALNVVKKASFQNKKERGRTGEKMHATFGKPYQWPDTLPESILKTFKQRHTETLIKLGYEKNANWL